MAKLFKIQAYIVDPNGEFNKYNLADTIEYGPYDTHLRHINIDEVDLNEWDDNHPLNRVDCPESEYEKYFTAKEQEGSLSPVSKRGLRTKTSVIEDARGFSTFTCSLCGKTALAEFVVHEDGTIETKQENAQIRGGLGYQVLYDNVCSQCIKKMSGFDNDKFLTIIDKLKNNTQPIISQNNTEEGLK